MIAYIHIARETPRSREQCDRERSLRHSLTPFPYSQEIEVEMATPRTEARADWLQAQKDKARAKFEAERRVAEEYYSSLHTGA